MSFKERWQKEKERKAARKAARRGQDEHVIGVGWYSFEQWEALTEVVPDRAELDDTYAEWMASAEQILRVFESQGVHAIKVQVDVEELMEWCRSEGCAPDGAARADFVAHLLQRPTDKSRK